MIGGPALQTNQKRDPSGPPFTPGSANNGLSVDPISGAIVLGNNIGFAQAVLLSPREIPAAGFAISLTGGPTFNIGSAFTNTVGALLSIDRASTTRIGAYISQSFVDAQMELIRIQAPIIEATTANYSWYQSNNTNTDLSHNPVMKWGYNVDRIEKAGQAGIWYAQEYHFESGGAIFLENHLEFSHAGGTNARLFSSTLQNNAVFANVTNQWDFRCNQFAIQTLQNLSMAAFSRAPSGQVNLQLSGVTPSMQFSDSAGGSVLQMQNTGGQFLINTVSVGIAIPVEILIDPVGSYSLGIRMPASNRFAIISFLRLGGQEYQMGLAGPTAGGGQANEFFWFDVLNVKIPMRFLPNGNILLNNPYTVADDTAALQVNGEISTIDPGAGRGRWKLGTVVVGAVVADAANYVEIQINGAIVKLIKAV